MSKRILIPIKGEKPYTYTNKVIVFYNVAHWLENLINVESIVLGIAEPKFELRGWLIVNDVDYYTTNLQFLPVKVVFNEEDSQAFKFVVNTQETEWIPFKIFEQWANYEFQD